MDANSTIKRITFQQPTQEFGDYPCTTMTVETMDGQDFQHCVSVGNGSYRPFTLSDWIIALHRHTDALQRFEASTVTEGA